MDKHFYGRCFRTPDCSQVLPSCWSVLTRSRGLSALFYLLRSPVPLPPPRPPVTALVRGLEGASLQAAAKQIRVNAVDCRGGERQGRSAAAGSAR